MEASTVARPEAELRKGPEPNFRGTGEELQAIRFPYRRLPEQVREQGAVHPVVIVGAGPVGLTLALDLAHRGQRVVVLDDDDRLSYGSRALCFAKRTLEVWDRYGVAETMAAKGVSWNVGRVFAGEEEVYHFDLLPESGHQWPAFVNLQQYYCEAFLVERAMELEAVDIRWKHGLKDIKPHERGARLTVTTPEGDYDIEAAWVVCCDGARSPSRKLLYLDSKGKVFRDRFLIVDVSMPAGFPTERWFWFDPPFHPRQSVLLHRQPDNIWRVDFQLGWDADPELEKQPERIVPRLRALLGEDAQFEIHWASVYTFSCRRLDQFVHGRVIFAGDSAHGVSPFGARGANSGVQDADNLGWKLDWVLRGLAGESLIATYGLEREYAADDNIKNSTRATDFITPKSEISRLLRDQVLTLARHHDFARRLVNSGRLSVPTVLDGSPLNTPDADVFGSQARPGSPLPDAPVENGLGSPGWLLRSLGSDFTLVCFGSAPANVFGVDRLKVVQVGVDVLDVRGLVAARLDGELGTCYLVRPDRHVCARWRAPNAAAILEAIARAVCCALPQA